MLVLAAPCLLLAEVAVEICERLGEEMGGGSVDHQCLVAVNK